MKRYLTPFVVTLAGCGTDPAAVEDTAALATDQIVLSVRAQGNGDAVLVSARVSSSRGEPRVLAEGDRLVASAEDAAGQALSTYDTGSYATLLPTKEARVKLTLARPSEQASADLVLPPPFTLTTPAGVASAAGTIPLSWDASGAGDPMTLQVSGSCVSQLTRGLSADTGSYALQPGDLSFRGLGCTLTASLVRARPRAPLGIASSTSGVDADQARTATIEVTP